jgi:hypothetical protein
MGLDMYLSAEKFISGYDYNKDENFEKILDLMKLDVQDVDRSATLDITVGYWRKANAIHDWFVKNVQHGTDNCQRAFVSREQMAELLNSAKIALEHMNSNKPEEAVKLLPPKSGFFFGSTEMGEGYKADLADTVRIIERCLGPKFNGWDFYYQSSW